MPKMKSHRGASKRLKRTKSGKLKRAKAFANHILAKKSPKRKRNLRKMAILSKGDQKRIDQFITK